MAMAVAASRNAMANYYASQAPYAALYSTAPAGGSPGTELVGGGYARQASNWGAAANGAVSSDPVAHSVASGATVAGGGYHSAASAGTFWDGGSLPSQTFSSAGTYKLSGTFTQT